MLKTLLKNILMVTSLCVVLLPQQSMGNTRIEKLVEPVALYPDALLAQIIPASTNPIQIVEAARYLRTQGEDINLNPDNDWHPSVKALLSVPPVLEMMNTKLSWTVEFGEAVKNEQEGVLEAIQKVRSFAYEAGELSSSDKQVVIVEKEVIKIVPAEPEVIYVPQYYSYPPSTTVVYQDNSDEAALVGFTVGLILGAAIADGHYFDWHHHGYHYSDDVYDDIRRIQEDRQEFVRERRDEAAERQEGRRDDISERQTGRRDDISERQTGRRAEQGDRTTERQTDRQRPSEPRVGDRSQSATQRQTNRQQQYQGYRSSQNQANRQISSQRQQSLNNRSGYNRSGSMFGGTRSSGRSMRSSSSRGSGSRGSGRSGGGRRR